MTQLTRHINYLVVLEEISRYIFKGAKAKGVGIILLDDLINFLSGRLYGSLEDVPLITSFQTYYPQSLVEWTPTTASAHSKYDLNLPLLDEEEAVLPAGAIEMIEQSKLSTAQILSQFNSRIKNGGTLCTLLANLYKSKVLSADNVQFVTRGRDDDNGELYLLIKGTLAIAKSVEGVYLNIKKPWSDSKYKSQLISLLQSFGPQVKTPHGSNTDEIRLHHRTISDDDIDGFSKLLCNVSSEDRLPVSYYLSTLKFDDDATLVSFPAQCVDGGYRYTRNGKPGKKGGQRYRCCRHHHGCKAKVLMDSKGDITRMWERWGNANPHSEECLNPPTLSDSSRKGNKNSKSK
ncbi:hypothetical protein ACHAWC_005930 [Mediolabrus comicus]